MLQALRRYRQKYAITRPGTRCTRTGQALLPEQINTGPRNQIHIISRNNEGTRKGRLHRPPDAAAKSLQVFNSWLVILLLSCFLLVGCGSNVSSVGGQSQNTPTPPVLTPSSTHGQQAPNCGEIDTTLNGKALDATKAKTAGNCFQQAYQHCQAATLTLKVHSLDTGANHVFTTKNINGKCAITDTVTHYIVPNNLKTTRSYSCSGLTMQADGLHFIACGSVGTIVVPI